MELNYFAAYLLSTVLYYFVKKIYRWIYDGKYEQLNLVGLKLPLDCKSNNDNTGSFIICYSHKHCTGDPYIFMYKTLGNYFQ